MHTRVIGRTGGRRVSRTNRTRLLDAAAAAAAERGPSRVSVKEIVARAGLSRGTFYALFADRDSCLAAVLEDLVEDVEAMARAEVARGKTAADRVARGVAGALRAADADLRRASCCAAPAGRHEPRLLAAQANATARLAEAIAQARSELGAGSSPMAGTQSAPVGAEEVLARVREHLDGPRQHTLIVLFGELLRIVAGPRLARDTTEPAALKPPPATVPGSRSSSVTSQEPHTERDWVPARSREHYGERTGPEGSVRLTRRTLEVLESLRAHPGESNRGLARHAGGVDAGQISKLLRRLEDRGLIANHGEVEYSWSANSWFLTDRGRELIDR
jgi:AcrR family transcriptional regulator